MNTMAIILLLAGLGIGSLLGWLAAKSGLSKKFVPVDELEQAKAKMQEAITQNAVMESSVHQLKTQLADADASQLQLRKELNETAATISRLNAELNFKQEKLDTQSREINNIGERFEAQFKILANSILEDKAEKFAQQQEVGLRQILDPLKQNIQTFKQEFEAKIKTESDERISLREQIRHMIGLNQTLSEQANNLTQALRGNVKQQGNWGEMILESILEHTGLQKNIHYFTQDDNRNHEGKVIRPDFIVKYPDSRAIVIDSKVSLINYEQLVAATDKQLHDQHLAMLIRNFRQHIDGLSAKSYHDVTNALDFVMMFVPVEAAYITAMQAEPSLWQYAYSKRVLLLSPTNLIAAMKLVNDMWQRDGISKHAQLIAEKAAKMYEKLVGFVDNFEKVGQQIEKSHSTWNDAFKQLSKGKGNLISQAEQMKQLRINTQKSLPATLTEQAMAEDGVEEKPSEDWSLPSL